MLKRNSELKILIVSMQYDYGDPARGFSYEWNHFYLGLQQHFDHVNFFDFIEAYQSAGRDEMQRMLLAEIKKTKPDVVIFSLYQDEFDAEFLVGLKSYAKTLCFFHDDNWRQAFVKKWAGCFDAFTTAKPYGELEYLDEGLESAVYLPFGVNEGLFCLKDNVARDIDVSFVGAWHPYREWLIKLLKKAGVGVEVYGYRWPSGMISTDDMINIFQRSKISLNFSNSASNNINYLLSSPKALWNSLRSKKRSEQIKGRHFEIPACGALELSYYVEGLEHLFSIGEEIAIYLNSADMIEKVRFYLDHDELRERVAHAGYQRTLNDHTYGKRFSDVFKKLGWMKE